MTRNGIDSFTELADFKTAAHWLALRGWSEAAGGNMSVRIDRADHIKPKGKPLPLPLPVPKLAGKYLLFTAAGSRARDIGSSPVQDIGVFLISGDGKSYQYVDGNNNPTSELPAHLAIHNALEQYRPEDKAILHTHPAKLIALCHIDELANGPAVSDKILSLQSEARLILPEGIGYVDHRLPGSLELGLASAKLVEKHHLVLWHMHGCLATGETLSSAFDKLEVFEKCAQIYWTLRHANIEPKGMTKAQIKHTLKSFGRLDRYSET